MTFAGSELEGAEVDYLCTTPPLLLNTIENVLTLYDSSRGRGTMAGDAASLMSPEVRLEAAFIPSFQRCV